MNIRYATDLKSNFPNEHEIHDVVELVCQRCGFDSAKVQLQCIGADRRKVFALNGIKLIRPEQFSVRIFIGCKKDALEACLTLQNDGNRGRPGQELFNLMTKAFSGRVFDIDQEPASTNDVEAPTELPSTPPTMEPQPSENKVSANTASVPVQPEISSPEPQDEPASETTVVPIQEVSALVVEELEVETKRYFDNPSHLHLVVCSLVCQCEEDTAKPFSFEAFKKALDEATVPKTAGLPVSMIRPFLAGGYIVRANPDENPARYTITQLAVDFARGPVPQTVIKKVVRPNKPTKNEPPSEGIMETALHLKQVRDDHQATLSQLEIARLELADLNGVKVDEEDAKAVSEIANLKKRLNELEVYRQSLIKLRSEISTKECELLSLEEKASDPQVLGALAKLEELRRLLA